MSPSALERRCVGINGQEPVLAGNLHTVPGIEHQRYIGTGGILPKILQRPAHAPEVTVCFEENLEPERRQRPVDCLRVVDGIGEGRIAR